MFLSQWHTSNTGNL